MANAPTPRELPPPGGVHDHPRLGEFLVASGFITAAQLEVALRDQSSWGGRLGQNLVDQGLIDERTLASAIARQLSLPYVDLEQTPPPDEVVRMVPLWIAERYGMVGIASTPDRTRILVACVDPTSNEGMREVRRVTGLVPFACVATASHIDRVVRRSYYGEANPEPSPDPNLHLTRHRIDREDADDGATDGGARLAGLEKRLDRLLDLVAEKRRD